MPDVLCSTALDGVLLAGAVPRFASVSADRLTLTPEGVAAALTPHTRAVVVAHLFGHGAPVNAIRAAAPGVPIIEDAVQGVGGTVNGQPIGMLGDLSVVSFNPTKMIGGRGGVLIIHDERWADARIDADAATLHNGQHGAVPAVPWAQVEAALYALLPASAARGYAGQLCATYRSLLTPFEAHHANVAQIAAGCQRLPDCVRDRHRNAAWLHSALSEVSDVSDLPLGLPTLRPGDAIWRFTFAAPSAILARRITRAFARHRLLATNLYPSLSGLMGQRPLTPLAGRLVNLWVDETATEAYLEDAVALIRQQVSGAPSAPHHPATRDEGTWEE
jgi:dTDP-4-amino-4,6-dideoxygalactose transaminase